MPIYYQFCQRCGVEKGRSQARFCRSCGAPNAKEVRNEQIVSDFLDKRLTIRQIANKYGMTFQRVHQIIQRTLPGPAKAYRSAWLHGDRHALYQTCQTFEEFVERSGLTPEGARQWQYRQHLDRLPTRRQLAQRERRQTIVAMYRSGSGAMKIARAMGWNEPSRVYKALERENITTRQHPNMGRNASSTRSLRE